MSVCDPNNQCEKCRDDLSYVHGAPPHDAPGRTALRDANRVAELEDMESRLIGLRLEARKLAKSGHPGVRAEGKRAEAKCNDDLAWVRSQLSKEE